MSILLLVPNELEVFFPQAVRTSQLEQV